VHNKEPLENTTVNRFTFIPKPRGDISKKAMHGSTARKEPGVRGVCVCVCVCVCVYRTPVPGVKFGRGVSFTALRFTGEGIYAELVACLKIARIHF